MHIHLRLTATLLALTIMLVGCSRSRASRARIVGTWEITAFGVSIQQIYSKDGTMLMLLPEAAAQKGKWSIDGDRLNLVFREGDKTATVAARILRLDEFVLVYEAADENGKTVASTWKRVK